MRPSRSNMRSSVISALIDSNFGCVQMLTTLLHKHILMSSMSNNSTMIVLKNHNSLRNQDVSKQSPETSQSAILEYIVTFPVSRSIHFSRLVFSGLFTIRCVIFKRLQLPRPCHVSSCWVRRESGDFVPFFENSGTCCVRFREFRHAGLTFSVNRGSRSKDETITGYQDGNNARSCLEIRHEEWTTCGWTIG